MNSKGIGKRKFAVDIEEFSRSGVASVSLRELVDWRRKTGSGRLQLPPIQRTLVWRNDQIINYWDSLLRGYPPGMFLVHGITKATNHSAMEHGTNAEGALGPVLAGDWQLFDGQQRVSALLLGFGDGQLAGSLRLWVDFADMPTKGSDLRYALRISSVGQPFGYKRDEPNVKVRLGERADRWAKVEAETDRETVFMDSKTLIDARAAVPLSAVMGAKRWEDVQELAEKAARDHACPPAKEGDAQDVAEINPAHCKRFFDALNGAMDRNAIVAALPDTLVNDPDEYTRFFERIGQGGTALTNDELTYSIIKQEFPHVRQRMAELFDKDLRFASEVDLVLATLRVARLRVERVSTEDETIPRPTPAYVKGLRGLDPQVSEDADAKEKTRRQVRAAFLTLMPAVDGNFPIREDLERIRDLLEGMDGLPRMLIARLPRECVDMLLLLVEVTRDVDPDRVQPVLRAFTLYCLLAVSNAGKAADLLFSAASGKSWSALDGGLRAWRKDVEESGIAYCLPTAEDFAVWRADPLGQTPSMLPVWQKRFMDREGDVQRSGDWMRHATTNREALKRALMWVQRAYIDRTARGFDPLSARDEDLPLDLDHIVPHDDFNFHFSKGNRTARMADDLAPEERTAFHQNRWIVGNSLGNFRWLCARANRRRKNGPLEASSTLGADHLIGATHDDEAERAWRALVGETSMPWDRSRIETFRLRVELRALHVLEQCVDAMTF